MSAAGATLRNAAALRQAVGALCRLDPALAAIESAAGPVPFYRRPPGFAALVRILVGQQLSVTAAATIFGRLEAACEGGLAPEFFLGRDDAALRAFGLSAQKARYCRALAAAIDTGSLDLERLKRRSDEDCVAVLTALPGIGPWTAHSYLLFTLCRCDIWPAGDLGLQASFQRLASLSIRPTAIELAERAEAWRPWRSVAARLLWHYYDKVKGPL